MAVRRGRTQAQLGIEEFEDGHLAVVSVPGHKGLAVGGEEGESARRERKAKEKFRGAGGFPTHAIGHTACDRHRHIDLDRCLLRTVGRRAGGGEQRGESRGAGFRFHLVPG